MHMRLLEKKKTKKSQTQENLNSDSVNSVQRFAFKEENPQPNGFFKEKFHIGHQGIVEPLLECGICK